MIPELLSSSPVGMDRRLYVRPELKEYSPTERLLVKQLDNLLELASLPRTEHDIFTQLDKGPIELANPGLIQYSSKRDTKPHEGYQTPQAIQNFLELLATSTSAQVLDQWIQNRLFTDNNQNVVDVLRATARFTESMIDLKWFKQLFEIYPEVITIQSIKNLGNSIEQAIQFLPEGKSKNHLINTHLILRYRFPSLLHYSSEYCTNEELPSLLEPHKDTILANTLTEIDRLITTSDATSDQIAKRVLNYLIHSGLQDVDHAIKQIGRSNSYPEITRALYLLGVNIHRVNNDDETTINAVIEKNNQDLVANPRVDIVNTNLSTEISGEPNFVWVLDPTGTYGPSTLGHQSFIERISMYADYIQKHYPQIHPLVLITPLVDLNRINYKDAAAAASEIDRTMNLLVHLAHLPHVHFTTQLQPDPVEAGSTAKMLHMMNEKLQQQLHNNFTNEGRTHIPKVELVYCAGSDEIVWNRNTQSIKRVLAETQDSKFNSKSVIICRAGDLVDILANGEAIAEHFDADIILTPGSNTSSSSAIKQIAQGNYSALSLAATDQIGKWLPESIESRRDSNLKRENMPVEEVYTKLLASRDLI